MLPTGAEGSMRASLVFIPHADVRHVVTSLELWELPGREPGAGAGPLAVVLLHRKGAAAEESSLRVLQAASGWDRQPGIRLHPEHICGVQKRHFAFLRQKAWSPGECKSICPSGVRVRQSSTNPLCTSSHCSDSWT